MKPIETWVVYNKYAKEVIWVAAEQFLCQRKWDELVLEPPDKHLVKNKEKLVVCTLQRALFEILAEHKAEISYLKEEYEKTSRWSTT